jgi:hypothetical protein
VSGGHVARALGTSGEWGFPLREVLALQDAWERAGEPARRDGSWHGFSTEVRLARAEAALEVFCKPGAIVLLHGARGWGKTQLACWLALRVGDEEARASRERPKCAYATWAELCEPGVLERARRKELLVVDEVDMDDPRLFGLVDFRYRSMLRTVLATPRDMEANLTIDIDAVLERVSTAGARIAWEGEP